MKTNRWLLLSLLALLPIDLLAGRLQETVEMADQFRSDGKIYVVVVVILILVLGLSYYAFRIDRKITNLEKRVDDTIK
ncbi:MAG: hypothetical protein O2887_12650 [Bacteroidetes bacterium]|nr:hypothetical protein [Bacteroidota bacterium]MDA1121318.1 hypothetical protein [Bacteroidota bacterium]